MAATPKDSASPDPQTRICYLFKPGDEDYLEEMRAIAKGEDPPNPRQPSDDEDGRDSDR